MTEAVAASVYERLLRPLLFWLDPETAHRLGQFVLHREFPWSLSSSRDVGDRLGVKVGDWNLKSPFGLAAGFDKNGAAVPGLQHLGFDYVTVGSILPKPSDGHPHPRLIRYPEAESMVNCYGLPSDGLDACAARFKRLASSRLRTRLIANIMPRALPTTLIVVPRWHPMQTASNWRCAVRTDRTVSPSIRFRSSPTCWIRCAGNGRTRRYS